MLLLSKKPTLFDCRPTLFQIVTTGPDLAFIVFGRSHSREQVLQIYQIVFQVSFEFFLHTPGKKYSLAYYKNMNGTPQRTRLNSRQRLISGQIGK